MARKEAMVQLSDELLALLDRQAERRSISRSAVIREAVEHYLAKAEEDPIGMAIAEGYTRFPPGTPDEWGDLEAQLDQNTLETLQRLDAEERAAGFEPW